jgi:transposase
MSVYLVEATKASCRVSGCLCRDRGPRYPSDATDAEWELLRPEVQAVMAELRRGPGGRPMEHDLRAVLDGIRYVNRYGIEWRALPVDFPPWQAVYAFFERWNARGLPQGLVDRLRGRLRVACGRADLPTAGSIDSQSVKAADTVGATSRGFDSGKRINGRKRHLAVDTLGLVLTVIVTAASVQDRDGACRLLALLRERFSTITLVWADGGYSGRLVRWAHTVLAITLTIVKRSDDTTRFVVLPRRWVVERTFGWLMRYRRLVRD